MDMTKFSFIKPLSSKRTAPDGVRLSVTSHGRKSVSQRYVQFRLGADVVRGMQLQHRDRLAIGFSPEARTAAIVRRNDGPFSAHCNGRGKQALYVRINQRAIPSNTLGQVINSAAERKAELEYTIDSEGVLMIDLASAGNRS